MSIPVVGVLDVKINETMSYHLSVSSVVCHCPSLSLRAAFRAVAAYIVNAIPL